MKNRAAVYICCLLPLLSSCATNDLQRSTSSEDAAREGASENAEPNHQVLTPRVMDHDMLDLHTAALGTKIGGVWKPAALDHAALVSAIKRYERKRPATYKGEYKEYVEQGAAFIEANIWDYQIEYAGVEIDGRKLVLCYLYYSDPRNPRPEPKPGEETIILDGGCEVLTALYDPEKNVILVLKWNGVA